MSLIRNFKEKLAFKSPSSSDKDVTDVEEFDIKKVRSAFPGLADGFIYADNAGGSQCLQSVVDRVSDYLLKTNVQLGADYTISQLSTSRVQEGVKATQLLFNAASPEEIALASSSTQAVENLARAIEKDIQDDEEIIITGEHESNASPWKKLAARRNLSLKVWPHTPISSTSTNPYALQLSLSALLPLLTSKTRLIAFTACSNILGSITSVSTIVNSVRQRCSELGARKVEFCLDCVAYAPHRRMDVRAWSVDYCYFSYYKVYGPHVGALYARKESLVGSLDGLTHHFLEEGVRERAYKLCPGGTGYEVTYAVSAVLGYLASLSSSLSTTNVTETAEAKMGEALEEAFKRITAHEQRLLVPLMGYLTSEEARSAGVKVVGSNVVDETRAPTVSFVVRREDGMPIKSKDIVGYFDRKGKMGIRYGHFYAYTLVAKMEPKVDVDDAVVRISLVHYNTVQEVEALVGVLKEALKELA